jgi:hypothetical protein
LRLVPEPGYLNGEPSGCFWLVIGTIAVVILMAVIRSCVWGA